MTLPLTDSTSTHLWEGRRAMRVCLATSGTHRGWRWHLTLLGGLILSFTLHRLAARDEAEVFRAPTHKQVVLKLQAKRVKGMGRVVNEPVLAVDLVEAVCVQLNELHSKDNLGIPDE